MRTVVTLLAAGLALAGCGTPREDVWVDGAWVRLGAVRGRPAAAYFTIHGGPTARTLINVTTDVTLRSEMHETMARGSMSSMTPLASIIIPADAAVAFKPGGRHVMLFDVNPGITPGSAITLTLTFGDGTRIVQDAKVVGAGDSQPKA